MFSIKRRKNPVTEAAGGSQGLFPQAAWQFVTVDAPESLELFGKQNRGHLEVTVTNNSKQLLAPGAGGEIMFSFKLLDKSGTALAHEAVRTALSHPIAPGASHTQKVTVIVPTQALEEAAAVRVGLLHEQLYWVESLYPQHPCTVRISHGGALDSTEAMTAAASQIWARGQGNGMRWPYGSMMVSEADKLFYIPVAKCACTSLKSMMINLAEIDRPEIARELGVHFVTDRFNTGVQLKDKPIDTAREILASDQYFKFSVIRDPYERLVSAYLEKFVYQRHADRNLIHTRQVISEVQGSEQIDIGRGISFDQFVEYILRQDPYDLDPHWRPQYLYFLGVPHVSRIFRLENIQHLEQHLKEKLGLEVRLGHANATDKSDFFLAEASTLTANKFDSMQSIHPDSFLSSPNAEAIRQYYREDFDFYQTAE
ncbi:MAG: sulfotransferase family 2 domain-containing protein [Halioglobus sp.]|nr:sulfotransferase family 2 domain-containing protein [Halioglobus sp.]